ncbi:MAG: NAD(P)H-binding protein [Blastocatellia bacterium]|nr:NAD(P)H-binding protein [Blastocatellia bacterium]
MNVLITGGTGHLGRLVVPRALAAGYAVRIASRRPRPSTSADDVSWAKVDLGTGDGIRESLDGIDAIVHAASDLKNTQVADVQGTKRLAEAARDAGVAHFLFVSIVGIDRIRYPYYLRKLEAERMLVGTGAPHSILRAAQFHAFVDVLLGSAARVPLVFPLPAGLHVQSVATEDVADRIVRALDDGPNGMLRDYAGPEPMSLDEAAAAWKAARGLRKPTLKFPMFGKTAAGFRAGHNTAPDGERGTITWREWLERPGATYGSGSPSRR